MGLVPRARVRFDFSGMEREAVPTAWWQSNLVED